MAYPSSESGGASRSTSGMPSPHQKSRSRTQSISSDRPSTIGYGFMSPPLSISPEAAYIAASAGSQIVTNDHDNHANIWYDQHGIEPSGETALVSNAALQLVNNFLDQLLFGFLSIARSTSLAALRPAVTEVLKPKLAKDAINQADEELREYLGGGDDEDMLQSQTPDSPKDWDLELVWKRTRLRCMVYSSLGDMEEEDEDFYMEQEHLDGGDEALGETVSPAVCIFLTSILEFMGEQALTSAGQAAYHRMRSIYEKERRNGATTASLTVAERITVEEVDMERVAFDRTIGRLWRAWKKRIRSPNVDSLPQHRSNSQDLGRHASLHMRQASQEESSVTRIIAEVGEPKPEVSSEKKDAGDDAVEPTEQPVENTEQKDGEPESSVTVEKDEEEWLSLAVSVPLPLNDDDIAEILLPGLGHYSDDEDEVSVDENSGLGKKHKKLSKDDLTRPKSLMIFSHAVIAGLPTPALSEPRTPDRPFSRKRANSLPTPSTSPYTLPAFKRMKHSDDSKEMANQESGFPEADAGADEYETADETIEEVGSEKNAGASKKKESKPSAPSLSMQTAAIEAATSASSAHAPPPSSTNVESSSDHDDAEDIDFTEEPEIMTSSRVSISGRSSSPSASDRSRPVSMSPALPARSSSVRSLRVIDVTGPRSPAPRSRTGSVEINDSATSRASNAPRVANTSAPRTNFASAKMSRTYTSESISEAEEIAGGAKNVSSTRSAEPASASASVVSRSGKKFEDMQAQLQSSPVIVGSSARAGTVTSPAQSPIRPTPPPTVSKTEPATTKVTILNNSMASGSFFIDDKPETEAPSKPPASEIVLPERSARRQANNSAAAIATVVAAAAAATAATGTMAQRELPPSPPRVVERSSPSSKTEQEFRARSASLSAQHGRGEGEPAVRKQSVASSISSGTSKLVSKRSEEDGSIMRPEDVARNFEQLIHSDQTIQYTLTPENMRDIDSTRSLNDGSSIVAKSRRSEDINRQPGNRSRSSSSNNRMEGKRSASISRSSALETRAPEASTTAVKLSGPIPRSPRSNAPPVSSSVSKARATGPQAREARVARESLADLAEFLRATGPSTTSWSPNGDIMPNTARTLNTSASVPRMGGNAATSRHRYQAREATIDKDDNSDLIDFIRRGPPNAVGSTNHRIPRTIAPFRTTMDSDQMSGAVGGRAIDATIPSLRYSAASTSVTDSSMGSSAGLLKKDNTRSSPKLGGGQSANDMFDMPDGMPKRKTRRVKDPYAIDVSDEEEELEAMAGAGHNGRRPAVKEESLLDFLNSVPPPVESNPVLFDIPETRGKQPPAPKKKASAPSLMSRFTRGNFMSSGGGGNSSRGLAGSNSASHLGVSNANESRSLSSRTGSIMSSRSRGHTPIQVNIPPGLDKYGTSSSAGINNGTIRSMGSVAGSGRVPMKRFEPREAQPVASRATQDLADFFRNSGPSQPFRS